jgi:hypothetical protein
LHLVVTKAKLGEDSLGEVENLLNLIGDLVRQAKDVSVVLGKAAHAEQAGKSARLLVAVNRTELCPPEGEIPEDPKHTQTHTQTNKQTNKHTHRHILLF